MEVGIQARFIGAGRRHAEVPKDGLRRGFCLPPVAPRHTIGGRVPSSRRAPGTSREGARRPVVFQGLRPQVRTGPTSTCTKRDLA